MKLNVYTRTAAVTALSTILLAGVTATSAEAQRGWRGGGAGFHAGGPGHFGAWRGGGGWRGGGWGGGWRGAGWRGGGWRGGGWGWNRGWNNDWGWGAAGLLGGLAIGALANNNWGYGGYYGAGWDTPVYGGAYYGGPYYRQCICR
jgi:hypothetical protein